MRRGTYIKLDLTPEQTKRLRFMMFTAFNELGLNYSSITPIEDPDGTQALGVKEDIATVENDIEDLKTGALNKRQLEQWGKIANAYANFRWASNEHKAVDRSLSEALKALRKSV